jgi:hypothetical protein
VQLILKGFFVVRMHQKLPHFLRKGFFVLKRMRQSCQTFEEKYFGNHQYVLDNRDSSRSQKYSRILKFLSVAKFG